MMFEPETFLKRFRKEVSEQFSRVSRIPAGTLRTWFPDINRNTLVNTIPETIRGRRHLTKSLFPEHCSVKDS